jgi:hypothetical protein
VPTIELLKQEHNPFSSETARGYSSTSVARYGVRVFWRLHQMGYEDVATSLIFQVARHFRRGSARSFSKTNVAPFMYDATVLFALQRFLDKSYYIRGGGRERALVMLAQEASPRVRDKVFLALIDHLKSDENFFESEWRDFRRVFFKMMNFPKQEISKELLRCAGLCTKRFSSHTWTRFESERGEQLAQQAEMAKARVELKGFREWLDGKDLEICW